MSKLRTITVTLKEEDGRKLVTVAPEVLKVAPGAEVQVEVEGSTGSTLIGVELHVPGNQARGLMYRGQPQALRRTDVIYEKNRSFSFRIGAKPGRNESHPYRVYAHFKGSTETVEGRTTKNVGPTMIVE